MSELKKYWMFTKFNTLSKELRKSFKEKTIILKFENITILYKK